jgi:hypothetical protein
LNLAGTLIFSTRMWPHPSRSRPIVGKLLSRSSFLRRTVSKGLGHLSSLQRGSSEYLPASFHNRSLCYGARVPGGVFSSLISALSPGMRRRPFGMLLQSLASVSKMLALLTGCGKKLEIVKGCEFVFFFSWYKCTLFQRHFFWGGVV